MKKILLACLLLVSSTAVILVTNYSTSKECPCNPCTCKDCKCKKCDCTGCK